MNDRPMPCEFVVEINGPCDSLGRQMFTASWLDDYLPPQGVRGQVFHTSLADFTARNNARGYTVRVLP